MVSCRSGFRRPHSRSPEEFESGPTGGLDERVALIEAGPHQSLPDDPGALGGKLRDRHRGSLPGGDPEGRKAVVAHPTVTRPLIGERDPQARDPDTP